MDIRENDGDTMEAGQQNTILIELLQELNGLAKVQFKHVSFCATVYHRLTSTFQNGGGVGSDWKLKLAAFKISNPNFELNDQYHDKFQEYTKQGPVNCGCGGNQSDEVGEHHDRDEIVFVHNKFIKAGEVVDVLLGIINIQLL